MGRHTPVIAVTLGEPAGIGPDLAVALAQLPVPAHLVFIGDASLLAARAKLLGVPLQISEYTPGRQLRLTPGTANIAHVAAARPVQVGQLDSANAAYVLATLRHAVTGCLHGEYDAMLTLPVHKGVINDAGISFTGHTEYLAQLCAVKLPVMMLMTEGLRVALATTHMPLQAVPGAISRPLLTEVITILHRDLQTWFGIPHPHIVVTGLNPHAGEQGHLGMEEITIIEPVLAGLRTQGMRITGPLPADTAFIAKYMQTTDAFLTMYHDQGLPVLKYLGFGKAVNITLGLPLLRTSVDHGTALDCAGTGNADTGSAEYALQATLRMLTVR